MSRLLAIAAMFALAVPTLAVAQGHDEHHPGGARPGGARPPIVRPPVQPHGPHGPPAPHFGGLPGPHGGPFVFHGHPYAWHAVHFAHPWVYPPGFTYRLWAVGAILPPLFWSTPTYYYPGWAAMGLPPPDPGYQYIEYGPDLLLVNVTTGQVVQVFPGAFY